MPHKMEDEKKLEDVRAHMKQSDSVGQKPDMSWEANEGALIEAVKQIGRDAMKYFKRDKKEKTPASGGVRG